MDSKTVEFMIYALDRRSGYMNLRNVAWMARHDFKDGQEINDAETLQHIGEAFKNIALEALLLADDILRYSDFDGDDGVTKDDFIPVLRICIKKLTEHLSVDEISPY